MHLLITPITPPTTILCLITATHIIHLILFFMEERKETQRLSLGIMRIIHPTRTPMLIPHMDMATTVYMEDKSLLKVKNHA